MTSDEIGFALVPSRTLRDDHPGHMSVIFKAPNSGDEYRGFYPLLTDFPDDCRTGERLRNHLFLNRVPGYIVDDFAFADRIEQLPEHVLKGSFSILNRQVIDSLISSETRRSGWYSFNPDDFEECHNCVTWAVATINSAAGEERLRRPRQGRIKLMVEQIRSTASDSPEGGA